MKYEIRYIEYFAEQKYKGLKALGQGLSRLVAAETQVLN
jgi:hypothetical protein